MRSSSGSRPSAVPAAGVAALLWLLLAALPAPARAHGARLEFERWGGFSPGAVRCQRSLARAAARCAARAWSLRRDCLSAQVAGESCDDDAVTAAIEAARRAALDAVDARCSELQAIELQYLGSFDLQADLIAFCRAWETAAASAAFGPLSNETAAAERRACAAAAADAVSDVMHLVFRTRRDCMDRIASVRLDAPLRAPLLEQTARRRDAAAAAVVARLAARCGPAAFAAIYGRPPAEFVAAVAARADCIGGAFYIQNAVQCAAAVCGNGIVEPGEACDDGNTAGGDGCAADCRD